jgi:hypothetical protein
MSTKNTTGAPTHEYGLKYWISQTIHTRKFGHTYVHAGARAEGAPDYGNISFSFRGWGRSLTTRKGHKYKVYARYLDTDKPVPSKVLRSL